MAGLEELRFLIVWGNVIGVFPFRMELDPFTKKYKQFTFSFKHPLTWWFLFCSILQIIPPIYLVLSYKDLLKPDFKQQLPNLLVIALVCASSIMAALSFCHVPILIRFVSLSTTVKLINHYEETVNYLSE